jgi:hypothetical protein
LIRYVREALVEQLRSAPEAPIAAAAAKATATDVKRFRH